MTPPHADAARWALLFGNFAIGCGVMVTAGSLNDIAHALRVSVPVAGQLTTAGAIVMGVGAPLLAAAVAGWDRRRLLTLALLWFGIGHVASAFATDIAWLMPLRAASVIGAAVFTPQAAAAIAVMARPAERGSSIAFVFLGWSVASVLGMPMHSYIAESYGWAWAFALVGALSVVGAALVWRSVPDGVKPPPLSAADWRRTLTNPLLMGIVAVTVLSASGQFTLFAYFAAYFRERFGAGAAEVSGLFFAFGAYGLVGNVALTRWIDRVGAARCVTATLALIALSLAALPLAVGAWSAALALLPWGLGCFASNSAQQARLGAAAPELTSALMALNSSAMYVGQAVGAASGGALIAAYGIGATSLAGIAWLLAAIALSVRLSRAPTRGVAHG